MSSKLLLFTRMFKRKQLSIVLIVFVIGFLAIVFEITFQKTVPSSCQPSQIKLYACLTFNGRLGNHVFQYASVYGIARMNNLTILLAEDDDIVQYFELPSAERRKSRDVCKTFIQKNETHCCVFDKTLIDLPTGHNYTIGNYLQSWKYFKHVFEGVRRELTFEKTIKNNAKVVVRNIRAAHSTTTNNAVIVGIHIRRGDLVSKNLGGFQPAPDSYIEHAIDWTLEKFPNAVFIACSDGEDYAKMFMKYRNVTFEYVHFSPGQDLAILATCDQVIMTVGSFGWWAGFLSREKVLYYKYPMKEGTIEREQYNYSDYYPEDWIGLE